jgi:hypothetical protein
LAGRFEGHVEITGDIKLLNADCAEDFDIPADQELSPGMLVVLNRDGLLELSRKAYDKKVAGIVSGAGNTKPAIIMDKRASRLRKSASISLIGKVYCLADASYSSIEVGDLLTTSDTYGHAMKATDPLRSIGAIIGKALANLESGSRLIPVLVSLQ